jgi:hypothetical protein
MLDHPWLKMPPNYDYKLTDSDISKMKLNNILGEE